MVTKAQKAAAAKKKGATKKRAASGKGGDLGIGTLSVQKTEAVQFKTREQGSKYDPIIEEALKLKQGETLDIPLGDGIDQQVFAARLGAVVRRKVKPVLPGDVTLRLTDSGGVAISHNRRKK